MVIDYLNPIAIVGNFLLYYIQYTMAYLMLTPRMKPLKTALLTFPFAVVNYIVSLLLQPWQLPRAVISMLLAYSPLILFFSDRLFRRVVVALLCAVISVLSDLCSVLLWIRDPDASYLSLYSMFVATAALLSVFFAAVFFRSYKRQSERLAERERIISLLIPFSQYVSIIGWLRYFGAVGNTPALKRDTGVSILFVVVLVLLSDYLFFKSIRRTVAAARLETENAALSQQVAAQARYYAALEDQFAANRKIRHDISNHLYTVRALLSDGKHAEAEQYALEYLTSVSGASLARLCQEPSVNAFLLYKQEELEKQKIQTDFDITLPADTGISSVDLVTVLGNLLDNAEEACRSIPDSRIRLRIRTESEQIMISEENPYASPLPHAERIPGLSRGVGYTILQSMAEKYGGVFTYAKQDGVYRCALSLKQT